MKNHSIQFILASLFILTCSIKSYTQDYDEIGGPDYDTTSTAVIPFTKSMNFPFGKNYSTVSLKPIDIMEIDSLLMECAIIFIKSEKDKSSQLNPFKNEWKKQLVAATNLKGEIEVWVNCLCEEKKNWRTTILRIKNRKGEACYFSIMMNLTLKKYYDLKINSNGE